MKHALETQPDLALRRPTRSYMAASWQLVIRENWYEDADNFINLRGQRAGFKPATTNLTGGVIKTNLRNLPEGDISAPATVGIVGAGRLGSSLALAMAAAGYAVTAASTRRPEHALWLAGKVPGATVTHCSQAVADAADAVFICVDDGNIKTVCDSLRWRVGQSVIHCSGAQPMSIISGVEEQGAVTGGFHPLQTFPQPRYGAPVSGIAFGVESRDRRVRDWLTGLAHDLGGTTVAISADVRAAYHASAVMACGLLAGWSVCRLTCGAA